MDVSISLCEESELTNVTQGTDYDGSIMSTSASYCLNNNVQFSKLDLSEIADGENALGRTIANGRTKADVSDTTTNNLVEVADDSHMSLTVNGVENGFTMTLKQNETNEDDPENVPAESRMETEESLQDEVQVAVTHDSITVSEREFFQHKLVELDRRLWASSIDVQHYTKGCIWSPDGTCILVPVHMDGMHVIELPTDLYQIKEVPSSRQVNILQSAVHVQEGGTVYDCVWYPLMNSLAPETCCWIASRQHEPIHMWDAFSGDLRCSYRGYDDVDEVQAAISVVFSKSGEKLIGGYKKSIKVFNTNIPGRDSSSIAVKQAISSFALNATNEDIITTGSWNGVINLYDLRVPKLGSLFTLIGHTGGITYLRNTHDSQTLFSGARKDNNLLQWDMRNYSQPVQTFQRSVETNQRIHFDLSPQNEWLASGDTKGLLRLWDLTDDYNNIEIPLHKDCCNGVNFHPSQPILATSSGQYHLVNVDDDKEKSMETIVEYENALVLWWFGQSDEQV